MVLTPGTARRYIDGLAVSRVAIPEPWRDGVRAVTCVDCGETATTTSPARDLCGHCEARIGFAHLREMCGSEEAA